MSRLPRATVEAPTAGSVILAGVLLGAMLPFVFSAMAMNAVGRAAGDMIKEGGRQFADTCMNGFDTRIG